MTPEERAAECLRVERGPTGKIDWNKYDELIVPDNLESLIAAAIRAAVDEERNEAYQRCSELAFTLNGIRSGGTESEWRLGNDIAEAIQRFKTTRYGEINR